MSIRLILAGFLALFCANHSIGQFYNGSNQEFGKSRVQYQTFDWKSLDYQRFEIFFYKGGKNTAVYAAQATHRYLQEFERELDYILDGRLEIMIYNSQTDFKQSNIGLNGQEQTNIGGTTQIVGSKMFLFFDGDHEHLERQIRGGLAKVMMNQFLFGGDWKDVIKSQTLMSFPEWFVDGFVSYMSRPWDAELDSKVKDAIFERRFNKFNNLEGEEERLAGHAMWFYIEEVYGREVLPDIVYLARSTRNVEKAILYKLGVDFKQITRDFINFYQARYSKELDQQAEPQGERLLMKVFKNREYYGLKVSPDGKYMAYVTNKMGKYRLHLHQVGREKAEVIFKAEPKLDRLQDYSFPTIAWHPSSRLLAFITERKGGLQINYYDLSDKKTSKRELTKVDKVLSMAYHHEGKKLIFSATFDGYSDLYEFDVIGGAMKNLTKDVFDDLEPRYVPGTNSIVFVSNRTHDTISHDKPEVKLYNNKKDIFILPEEMLKKHKMVLTRVTNTSDVEERDPIALKDGRILFTSDQNGLVNRFIAWADSAVAFIDTSTHYRYFYRQRPLTNYRTSVIDYDIVPETGRIIDMVYQNHQFKFFKTELPEELPAINLVEASYLMGRRELAPYFKSDDGQDQKGEPVKGIDTDNYRFEDENPNYHRKEVVIGGDNKEPKEDAKKEEEPVVQKQDVFELPNAKPYSVNFAKDFVLTQVGNDFLDGQYQRYAGPGSIYFNPGLSAMLKMGFSDLFEDYKILGGIRIPGNFDSGEQLAMFDFLPRRVDHRLIIHRNVYKDSDPQTNYPLRWKSWGVRYRMSYPFNDVFSFRFTTRYRYDRKIHSSVDDASLGRKTEDFNRAALVGELVFDNARYLGLNLWDGWRAKIFGEASQEIYGDYHQMYNVGGDIRYYQKLHRNLIAVFRVAGATSFGPSRVVYYMGSVDNWMLRPREYFDESVRVDPDENFTHQAVATPLRGFIQNSRNGNSFVVANTEIRWPVLSYLTSEPINSDFFRNFQLVLFGDVGTAWTGPNPWSDENFFNVQVIDDNPVTVELQNQREPIAGGFGFGARTKLLGYFMRLDVAWGVENMTVKDKPVVHFSLSLDI